MKHEAYLEIACTEGLKGMRDNKGGPFGAIIVLNGEIIARGCNMVTSTNDPTAHAEIVAIRKACNTIHHYHLEDAVLYSSCEPCPMCLSAIYWANIKKAFFATDRHDAARIGFNDNFIYEDIFLPLHDRSMEITQLPIPLANELFEEWSIKQDKMPY